MKAVFVDADTFSPNLDLSNIKQQVNELICYPTTNTNEIIDRCLHAEVVITNKVVFSEKIMLALPKLKLICVAATGTNNIDLVAAKKLGITVTNAAGYAGNAVAQYIFSQLLHHFQHIDSHNKNTKQGKWQTSGHFCFLGEPINELAGLTLGLIGYGHIAEKVAVIAKAFDMKVLVSERKGASTCREGRYSFEQVLTQADVISLHCPLTDESFHLINNNALSLMKPSAVLVNTARGDIVDSSALITALKTKQINKAILDVLPVEPPPENCSLLQYLQSPNSNNNLVITAHIAWASQQAQQRLLNIIADNIGAFTQNSPINLV